MLTDCTASGLYYLSELVEEHTVFAKKFLTRLIYAVISFQILLCLIDGFPFWLSLLSILSHVVYLGNMRRFPIVKLSDPLFIVSCGTDFCALLQSLSTDGIYRTCVAKPLGLVHALLYLKSHELPHLPIRSLHSPHVHGNSIILWTLCVAGPILPLRFPFC
jgi:hypothetical protein